MLDNLSEINLGHSRPTWVTSKNFRFSRLCNVQVNTNMWDDVIVDNYEFWRIEQSPQMCQLTSNHLEQRQDTLNETRHCNNQIVTKEAVHQSFNLSYRQQGKMTVFEEWEHGQIFSTSYCDWNDLHSAHISYQFWLWWIVKEKLWENARPGAW